MKPVKATKEKVCIVAPVFPAVGGLRSVLWHLIEALNEKYGVMVLSVKWRDAKELGYAHCDIALSSKAKLLFSPWHFPSMILYLLSGMIWCFALRMIGVKKFLAQEAIISSFLVTLLGKITGARAYVFDYAPMLDLYSPRFAKTTNRYQGRILRRLYAKLYMSMNIFSLKHCYKFFVYSPAIERCALEHGLAREKTAFYGFPIDVSVFRPYSHSEKEKTREKLGFKRGEIVVTYVGRISGDKGFSYLFDAAENIIQRYGRKIRFVVAGDGPLTSWVIKNAADSGGYITYQGPLHTPTQVAELLNASDIFVHPITVSYGYALSVLEAMATGLPSIMTDVGLTKEVIVSGHNGIIVPTGDVNAFTDALDNLIKNKKLRRDIGKAGREVLEKFSVEIYKETMLNQIAKS